LTNERSRRSFEPRSCCPTAGSAPIRSSSSTAPKVGRLLYGDPAALDGAEGFFGAPKRSRLSAAARTYRLDGSLSTAPYYGRERGVSVEPEAAATLGLLPVASHVWAGQVFVDLSASDADPEACAADFARWLAPLSTRWAHIDFDRLHLAGERRYDIGANWKLVVENFLDFYHLPFVPPQVGPVTASLDVDDVALGPDILGGSYPHGAIGKADKTDSTLPWLGEVPADRVEHQDIFCVFPNALLFLEADWFQVRGWGRRMCAPRRNCCAPTTPRWMFHRSRRYRSATRAIWPAIRTTSPRRSPRSKAVPTRSPGPGHGC
jgi:hypothetical protein